MGGANPTHTVPTHIKKREPEATSELQGAGKNIQDEIRERSRNGKKTSGHCKERPNNDAFFFFFFFSFP